MLSDKAARISALESSLTEATSLRVREITYMSSNFGCLDCGVK